jgi:hypothetical protein
MSAERENQWIEIDVMMMTRLLFDNKGNDFMMKKFWTTI